MKKALFIGFFLLSLLVFVGCQKDMVTITFDALYVTSPESIMIESGVSLELPEPEIRTGFTFDGWYEDQTYLDEAQGSYKSDTTLYAKWVANTYTITFDTQGGEAVEPMTYTYMDTITLPIASKDGYIFRGWFLEEEPTHILSGETMITMTGGTLIASFEKDYDSELLSMLSKILHADSITIDEISTKRIHPSYIKAIHVAKDDHLFYNVYQENQEIMYQYADHLSQIMYINQYYYPDYFFEKDYTVYTNLGQYYYDQALQFVDENLNLSWFDVVDDKFVLRELMFSAYQQSYTDLNLNERIIHGVTYEVTDDTLCITIENLYADGSTTTISYEMMDETEVELPNNVYEAPLIQGIHDNHITLGYLHKGDQVSLDRLTSLNAYLSILNAEGGINGHTFEIIAYAHENSDSLAVSSLRRLMFEDQVYGLIMSDLTKSFPEMIELISLIPNFPVLGYTQSNPYVSHFPFVEHIFPMMATYREEARVIIHQALHLDVFGELFNEPFIDEGVIGMVRESPYDFSISDMLEEFFGMDFIDVEVDYNFVGEPYEKSIEFVTERFSDKQVKAIFMFTTAFVTDDILLALEEKGVHVPVFLSSESGYYDKSIASNLSFPVYTIQSYHIYDDLGEKTEAYQHMIDLMGEENVDLYTGASIYAYQIYQPIFEHIFSNLTNYQYTELISYIDTHDIPTPFGGLLDYRDGLRDPSFALFEVGETHFIQVSPYQTLTQLSVS